MHDRSPPEAPISRDQPTGKAEGAPAMIPGTATEQIEYFNAPYAHRPSAGPGMVLGVLGLGLIFLGGCFMIGVLALYGNSSMNWSQSGIYLYLAVLYLMASLCFTGAALLLRLAVRSLLKADRG